MEGFIIIINQFINFFIFLSVLSPLFRGCTVKLFQSGDYEYLCKVYGLSGASGTCGLHVVYVNKN